MTIEELKRLVLLIHRRVDHLVRKEIPRDCVDCHPIDHEEISKLVAALEKDLE